VHTIILLEYSRPLRLSPRSLADVGARGGAGMTWHLRELLFYCVLEELWFGGENVVQELSR
jgi:hypothetical protein